MRKYLYLLLTFAIVVTAARALNASTDCQKWLADYKKALADKTSAPKLLAAKHRARHYAHRKVVQLTTASKPVPAPSHVARVHPRLTPAQMLKHFDLVCGELPIDAAPQVLDARMSPDEFVSETAMSGPIETEGGPGDSTLIAENSPPAYDGHGVDTEVPTSGPYNPVFGTVPGGGSGFTRPTPPVLPPVPPPPVLPPAAPVPEPSSILLLLTGGAGAWQVLRRRV